MKILCKKCDQPFIENESEYYEYLATLRKKNGKSLYKTYTMNNISLDEVSKIINDYIWIQNKKLDFYFLDCEFVIEFDNNL